MLDTTLVIALVDDDPSIRDLVELAVCGSGDTIITAPTFARADLVLREYPWDVAIIERRLPDGDGLELCRAAAARIEEHDSHRHIVILSGLGAQDERLRGFEAGADEYLCKPAEATELRARLAAIRRVVLTQKALLARVVALEQISVIDGLTEVYNHRFFEAELRRLFDIASRHQRPLAIAMIDLDHFKNINDTWGHRVGDQVLREVSTAIAQSVRASDILARYGGEEFALLLPETTVGDAAALAERTRSAVEDLTFEGECGPLRITISVGIAGVPTPQVATAPALLEAADRALYAAKEAGRNCVRVRAASPARDGVELRPSAAS